jgi:hypothetical protein
LVAVVPTPLPEPFIKLERVGEPGRLPVAHVCFHSIDLPDYPSKTVLRAKLLAALDGSNGSFGVLEVLLLLLSCLLTRLALCSLQPLRERQDNLGKLGIVVLWRCFCFVWLVRARGCERCSTIERRSVMSRCGRTGHWASNCFAKTHASGFLSSLRLVMIMC